MSAQDKVRLLQGLVRDCRAAVRKMRTGSSKREREAGADEYAESSTSALTVIKSLLGKNKSDTLARFVLGSTMLATLPNGKVRTNVFGDDGPAETASMSDAESVPAESMRKAQRLIALCQNETHAEQF